MSKKIPDGAKPYVPKIVDVLRPLIPGQSPYPIVAEIFDCSVTRVRQVCYEQRDGGK